MASNRNIFKSFGIAWNGIWAVLVKEPAFKYFVLAGTLVVSGMLYFPTSRTEKGVLLTMIFAVLTLELMNAALERFLDFLRPQADERVRIIKDLLAAIVLVAALGAAAIGLLIFWPHIQPILFK